MQQTKYNLLTHSSYSHNYLETVLKSNNIQYSYMITENEESYSRFEVYSSIDIFNDLKALTELNNGTSITIQYGTH